MDNILFAIDSTVAAFIAGLVTSVHCAGMCGPLACYLSPKPEDRESFVGVTALYHGGRILSYTLIGMLAGALGMFSLQWVQRYEDSFVRLLPWAMVGFFLVIAFRLDKSLFKPALGNKYIAGLLSRIRRLPRLVSAGTIGLVTPALPCAPLYAVFALALMTQSPARGAEFLFAFALGTIPLLWLVQLGWNRAAGRVSPLTLSRLQRGVAGAAALLIGLRLYFYHADGGLPFCGS